MKVSELMEILEEQDPDADVLIMSQENWPMEQQVHGVTTRADMLGEVEDDGEPPPTQQGAMTDVFIVEGEHVRYGSKAAWDVATR